MQENGDEQYPWWLPGSLRSGDQLTNKTVAAQPVAEATGEITVVELM